MTPHQVLVVAALGGLAAVVGLVLVVLLAVGLHAVVGHLVDRFEACRDRFEACRAHQVDEQPPAPVDDLTVCRAIDALGTTGHPVED